MLESLITSKTRIRLLLKFFLNPSHGAYLRELAQEFNESTNSVRVELNRMAESGLLESTEEGRTKVYRANRGHPLFPEISRIVAKTVGLDSLIEQIVERLGNVKIAFVTGDYAKGIDSGLIDLVLVGAIDETYLAGLSKKVESLIGKKIRALPLTPEEFQKLEGRFREEPHFVVWDGERNGAEGKLARRQTNGQESYP